MRRAASQRRPAACRAALAAVLVGWLLLAAAASTFAADPSPSPGSDSGGDTRTPGEGPGLVGSPLFAVGGVRLVALVSIGLAQAYLRATADRSATGTATDETGADRADG